jgi:hypothetical protein
MRHVDERYAGGLGEDRRRFSGVAEVDRAGVERLEQRGPDGNSFQSTLNPRDASFFSRPPVPLSRMTLPYFW